MTDFTDFIKDMFTVPSIKLKINQLQSLQTWQTVEKVLHVLQDHASRAKYLHLISLLGKVTGEHIGEAFDVG